MAPDQRRPGLRGHVHRRALAALLVVAFAGIGLLAGIALAGTYNYYNGVSFPPVTRGWDLNANGTFRCVYRNWNRAYSQTGAFGVSQQIVRCSDGQIVHQSAGGQVAEWGPAGSFYPGIWANCRNDSFVTTQSMVCSTTVP